jgi:hypothetical protein
VVQVVALNIAPASAGPLRCLDHLPVTAEDYQAVPDQRDASFGIGDLTTTVRLPDGRTLFIFGDTAYYNVTADGRAGPFVGFGNNSAWVQSGKCFRLLDSTGNDPGSRGNRSWILPPERDGSVYWPGGAAVVGSRLYVFLARMRLDSTFGTPLGSAVATFELPSLQLARLTPAPFASLTPSRVYGTGAVYDGGYLYMYASQAQTCSLCFSGDLYVARVPENKVHDPAAWQYRTATGWDARASRATPVLAGAVSNTSVRPYGNGFLLLTKPFSIISPEVRAWWAPNPDGPWQDLGTVFSVPVPPPSTIPGFTYAESFTYNPSVTDVALAGGGLLASYNVNSFDEHDGRRDGRGMGPRFFALTLPPSPSAPPRPTVTPARSVFDATYGVERSGRVRTVGGGTAFDQSYTRSAVAVARTPTGLGGWVAAADGGVFAYGDAKFLGSMGGTRLNQPIVGMSATPSGRGYWLVARDGGIFSFGDARFYGSTGSLRLNRPILAMASSPTGRGYWLVASDGGMFTFGDAAFLGSLGASPPLYPITGMAATPNGRGYWLVDLAGEVFAFGAARYYGNAPLPLASGVVGIVPAPGGYRLVDGAGHVFQKSPSPSTATMPPGPTIISAG